MSVSVRPSVRPNEGTKEITGLTLDEFSLNLLFGVFKICHKNSVFIKV